MPMIDVYASAGTFDDPPSLATELAHTLMTIRASARYPDVPTEHSAFVHDLPPGAISNVNGDGNYVRVQVLDQPRRTGS